MKAITIILILFSTLLFAEAKEQNITGTVTNNLDGKAITGVAVTVVENKNAVVYTDKQGKYSIVAHEGQTLRFSMVGFLTEEVKISKQKVLNMALLPIEHKQKEVGATSIPLQYQAMDATTAGVMVKTSPRTSHTERLINRASIGVMYTPNQANTESYKEFKDNSFNSPLKNPLSTFAADVDGAAYSNVKRFLQMGNLPPVDAVRIEEMINYFPYDIDGPQKNVPVNIMTELTKSPWSKENQLLRVSLKAKDISRDKLPPANLVFLIDVSGSMSSYNKLPLVKSSFKLMVNQLRPEDRVSLVVYAGQAQVLLESIAGDKKMKIIEAIDALQAGGSTAGGDGLKMAYRLARENFIKDGNNRIIMATDGDFNVGASSDADMEKLIVKERESGVNISVLGYGMGNYKDAMLETLANKGRGNYAYINEIAEARKAIINEFGATFFTVAKDVKIQVEFNPKYVQYYRLIGYENRVMADEDFNNDTKIGGDMGVGHMVTALYEIVPVGVSSTVVGTVDPLKYQNNRATTKNNKSQELATVKFRYKDPKENKSKLQEVVVLPVVTPLNHVSEDLRFISAVAELGMLLRNSEFKQDAAYDSLILRAKAAKGQDKDGYRSTFIQLAEDAKALANKI